MSADATWTPRDGSDFGEATVQARLREDDVEDVDEREWHTDAYEMRMQFGIPEFDFEAFDYDVYRDCLVHEKPADRTNSAGGTDWLRIGERGSGKSNDSLHWAIRLLEVNDERVVWRGSPQRSEWLPLRDWTTVWVPENAAHTTEWEEESEFDAASEADLEELVREVRTYEDPVDLLEKLEDHPAGTFNVVYPDPSFQGCEGLTTQTDRVSETLPFVPEWEAIGEETGTPLPHWWYAFMLAAVDHRPRYSWLSVIFDEAGDLFPENAEDDAHKTFAKINLLRSCYADSRRRRLSIYWAAHYEENLHHKVRREVMHRIDMADKTPNPRTKLRSSIPVGFDTVPMRTDIMSSRKVGVALLYNQKEFQIYRWKEITSKPDDEERWLKITLGEPERDDEDEDTGPTLRYEPSIFRRWTAPSEDRLYVKDPGEGYVDAMSGQEIEPLASPRDGWHFAGVETRTEGDVDVAIVQLVADETGESKVVAEIPIEEFGLDGDDMEAIA